MIRALIFDFDGLILDTESPIFQSWQELYRSFQLDLPLDRWADTIGRSEAEAPFDPKQDLKQRLGTSLDWDTLGPRRRQRELALIAAQPALPGVHDYLERARQLNLKIGLASSSDYGWVSGHLEHLGLRGYFDCLRTSEDVHFTKPAPDLFLATLVCLDVRAREAVVFEDSPNGILAANRAGIFCVAVPNPLTNHLNVELADRRLAAFTELSLDQLLIEVEQKQAAKT